MLGAGAATLQAEQQKRQRAEVARQEHEDMERMVAELSEDEREAFRAFEAADPVGEVDPLANNPWERRQLAHRVSPMILVDWGCVLVEACRGLLVLVDAWGFAVPPVNQMLAGAGDDAQLGQPHLRLLAQGTRSNQLLRMLARQAGQLQLLSC